MLGHQYGVPGAGVAGEAGPRIGIELVEGQKGEEVVVLLHVGPPVAMMGERFHER